LDIKQETVDDDDLGLYFTRGIQGLGFRGNRVAPLNIPLIF